MPQPTSPVLAGGYNTDVVLDTASQVYASVDGASATTLFGSGISPSGATVSMTEADETLGGQNAGFTIYEDQDEFAAVDVTAPGATIEGNTLVANAAYIGTEDYEDNFDLYAPAAGAITIGGTLAGEGNTFAGSAPYLAIVDGTNVDIAGNTFSGSAEFYDIEAGGTLVTLTGNTFTGSATNGGAAIQLDLSPNSFVYWANNFFGESNPLDEASSYTVSANNFDGYTGIDIQDVMAGYTFAGSSAQRTFTGTVNSSGIETDTVTDWQPGDTVTIDSPLYSVAAVHQNGPDEVQIFLQATSQPVSNQENTNKYGDSQPDLSTTPVLTGDQIDLVNLKGVSATQVASMLGGAPIANGPIATSTTFYAGPSQSLDLTSLVNGLWGPGTGTGDDPDPKLVAVGPLNPSSAGTLNDIDGDITFLTPPNGASGAFTYTVEDEYGDLAQGTVTVDTDPGPTAKAADVEVGISQKNVNLTSQILADVTRGAPNEIDTISGITTYSYTNGKAVLNNGTVTYTPGPKLNADVLDTFTYQVEDQYGQTSSNSVYVTIDNGPTAGTVHATVSATPSSPISLTADILAKVTKGLSGDTETITGIGTSSTLGQVSLTNGVVDYTATSTSPQNELSILSQIAANGTATDSFTYTVSDQFGDTSTGTVDLVLTPIVLNGPAGNGNVINGTLPTQEIKAPEVDDTINLNGNNDVVFGSSEDTINTGSGDAVVELNGLDYDKVTGGNGWTIVKGATSNNTVSLGNGNDTVSLTGSTNKVTLGSGSDTVTLGTGGSNTVTLGAGTDDEINAAAASPGGDTFTLNASNAQVYLSGTSNEVVVNGGTDTVTDSTSGADALTLDISASGGKVTVHDFSIAHGLVDLAPQLIDGGVLGAAPTAATIAGYMNTHGGVLPFDGSLGSLSLVGDAGHLTAANFRIA